MTGSVWVPIVVPIVALLALGSWLAMIYYADAHPQYQHGSTRQAGVASGLPVSDARDGATGQELASAAQHPGHEAAPSKTVPSKTVPSGAAARNGAGRNGAAHGDDPQPAPAQAGRHAA
jgi:hypothetical protein